jgi:pilus assembly protein FimV
MRESSASMKLAFPIKPCALAVLLLCAAASSSALTLGRARGVALLGQPFEMQVPVVLAPDEDGSGLCFSADVYYGESRQEASKVGIKTELGTTGQPAQLRISARTPIDEPVVTVYVRAACGMTTSRRYVLLADLASELAPAPPNLASSPALRLPSAGTTPRAAVTSPAAPAVATPPSVAIPNSRTPAPAAVAVPARKARSTPRATAAPQAAPVTPAHGSRKSRLKLAPLDLSQDWEPSLKSSPELLAPPIEDTERRLAAAAVWKTLNLTPEEVLRDATRLQDLERSVAKLSELATQNQRQTQVLIERLESSEAQRYSNPLVYALVVALAAMVALLVWMWRKLREVSDAPWWNAQSPAEGLPARDTRAGESALVLAKVDEPQAVEPAVRAPSSEPKPQPAAALRMDTVDIDLNLDEMLPPAAPVPTAPVVPTAPERRVTPRDFSGSMSAPLRSINTQEVLDIRQQAEFFMTLGQYDDAISLLEAHIAENPRSNPLVYLDLLKALHTLSRKVTFDHYRTAFNSVFTGQVPVYTQFNQVGAGLEAYPELCQQIASLWPAPAVIEFIETYLVRDPAGATDLRLDLEAFRDLLLLHAIAGRLGAEHPSGVMPFSAAKNVDMFAIKDPATTAPADTGTVPVDAVLALGAAEPTDGSVDLDLSDLSETPTPPVDNLIDFDASGLSLAPRNGEPRS